MRCGPLAAGGSTLTGAPSAPLYPHPLERRGPPTTELTLWCGATRQTTQHSQPLVALVTAMLNIDPAQRPEMDAVDDRAIAALSHQVPPPPRAARTHYSDAKVANRNVS
jgi:hypothetical protein